MKHLHVAALLAVLSWTAGEAWGQYGLYGSPEMLRLPPVGPAVPSPAADPAAPLYGASASPALFYGSPEARPVPQATGFSQTVDPRDGAYLAQPGQGPPAQPVACPPKKPAPAAAPPPMIEPPQPAPNVVEQMLEEPGVCGPAGAYGEALAGPCADECAPCAEFCQTNWYVSAAGLILGRNDANRVWTTFQANDNANNTVLKFPSPSWEGGWEIRLGRRFCWCCQRWALEATYWGLVDMEGDASGTNPNLVSTTFDFTDVVYADPNILGLPVQLFDGALEHKAWRRNAFHSVELNLIHNRLWEEGDWLDLDWMVGVRYFRFEEDLGFASRHHVGAWGSSPTEEGFLTDSIENNLIGFQLGFDASYALTSRLSVFCVPKIGIYDNHIHNRFDAYRGDGALFGPNPNPPVGNPVPGTFPVSSTTDALAFLTQIDVGLDWQFARQWDAFVGYRVVIATGIGLADNQYPHYIVDIPEIAEIDYNGELILHGGFAGLTYRF